jgi:hypothetical protein
MYTFTGNNAGTACPLASGTVGTDDDGCATIAPYKRADSICPADNATGNFVQVAQMNIFIIS